MEGTRTRKLEPYFRREDFPSRAGKVDCSYFLRMIAEVRVQRNWPPHRGKRWIFFPRAGWEDSLPRRKVVHFWRRKACWKILGRGAIQVKGGREWYLC